MILLDGKDAENQPNLPLHSDNCVYYWECTKDTCPDFPKCEYIGMTKRGFQKRLSEHRDYPKRDVITEPSGEHFSKRGHSVANLKGQVQEKTKTKDPFILKARESLFIKNLTLLTGAKQINLNQDSE